MGLVYPGNVPEKSLSEKFTKEKVYLEPMKSLPEKFLPGKRLPGKKKRVTWEMFMGKSLPGKIVPGKQLTLDKIFWIFFTKEKLTWNKVGKDFYLGKS